MMWLLESDYLPPGYLAPRLAALPFVGDPRPLWSSLSLCLDRLADRGAAPLSKWLKHF